MECLNCNSEKLVYDKASDAYVCLNCKYRFPKQYFFISHSHLDIEKVRIIRNIIEETFFYEPILFFLKCLSDDNELQSLIRREINERIWFVYCKSQNAENSRYVREERAYLQKLKDDGKKFNEVTIELDKFNIWDKECYDYIREQIEYHIRKTKPFICYAMKDVEAASAIRDCLQYNGYSVWTSATAVSLDDWGESVKSKIKEHSYKDGCILLLVSEKSVDSKYIKDEIAYATSQNAFILPIICYDDANGAILQQQLTERYPQLKNMQYLTFDTTDPFKSAQKIFKQLSELQPNERRFTD